LNGPGMREIIFGFPAIFACLIFLVSSCCGEVKLDVRNQKFFTVKDLKRIPEYFTGREFSGWKVYCRSNPQVRDGFYFVIKVGGKKQISSMISHWIVDWVTSADPMVKTQKVSIPNLKLFGKEVFVGLTGDHWTDRSLKPLAWRLRLIDDQGTTLGSSQSFLWSK
jgi:hypothetical protein